MILQGRQIWQQHRHTRMHRTPRVLNPETLNYPTRRSDPTSRSHRSRGAVHRKCPRRTSRRGTRRIRGTPIGGITETVGED